LKEITIKRKIKSAIIFAQEENYRNREREGSTSTIRERGCSQIVMPSTENTIIRGRSIKKI
jgi:hypothetical protein